MCDRPLCGGAPTVRRARTRVQKKGFDNDCDSSEFPVTRAVQPSRGRRTAETPVPHTPVFQNR